MSSTTNIEHLYRIPDKVLTLIILTFRVKRYQDLMQHYAEYFRSNKNTQIANYLFVATWTYRKIIN